ncbi:hypothetical protein GQR58_011490 [Nymphon striatum]|nr:hypothetical protein GQR58_011490 [Nymphon striatum]
MNCINKIPQLNSFSFGVLAGISDSLVFYFVQTCTQTINLYLVNAIQFSTAFLFTIPVLFCSRLSPLEVDGNALKIALRCVGAIVITSGKYNMFTYVSLTEGSVMLAVSSAILVYISSCVFLKHMLTIKDVVCMVAAIGGTILANIEELLQDRSFDLDILKGYLFGTASAIGYGFSAVVSNKMGTLPVTILMFYLLITQMLFNWFMVIILQETILIYDSMLYINLFGLVVVFYITQYCLNKGLQVGNPTYCLIGGYSHIPTSAIIEVLIIGNTLSLIKICGSVFVTLVLVICAMSVKQMQELFHEVKSKFSRNSPIENISLRDNLK